MQPGDKATSDLPPFAEAVAEFSAFLRHEGAPEQVRWVFREDVTSYRRRSGCGSDFVPTKPNASLRPRTTRDG
jgi:hypothetical protein